MKWINKKTGKEYHELAEIINTTNSHDGEVMTVYTDGVQTFARENTEFEEKFTCQFEQEYMHGTDENGETDLQMLLLNEIIDDITDLGTLGFSQSDIELLLDIVKYLTILIHKGAEEGYYLKNAYRTLKSINKDIPEIEQKIVSLIKTIEYETK